MDDATSLSAKLNSTLIVGKARASWLKEKRESCTVHSVWKPKKEDKKIADGWNVDFLYYYDIF